MNIDNYNNFLKKLDQKQILNDNLYNKDDKNENTEDSEKKNEENTEKNEKNPEEFTSDDVQIMIQKLLNTIEKRYINMKYDSSNFSGSNNTFDLKIDENNNPNNYKDDVKNNKKETSNFDKVIRQKKHKSIKLSDEKKIIDESSEIKNIKIKTFMHIDKQVNDISDLLKIIDEYKLDDNYEYNINLKALHRIKEPLNELNNMIGMSDLKNNVVDQILYFLQNLHKSLNKNYIGDFMHTVIYGPPGTGKTEIAKIMGKIYSKMGVLTTGNFKKVTRSDLIAGYLGQTAIKTKDVIKDSLGGVLFIDEAYALGNNEKRDTFSKECIDTLCEALSDYKDDLMVIIAGYENELNECFFSYNQGLDSRFTWRFKTDNYKGNDLYKIFIKKIYEIDWSLDAPTLDGKWFEKNLVYFKYFGRDIETLISKIKICHSRRVFSLPKESKKVIIMKDLEKGFELFLKNDEVKNRRESEYRKNSLISTMYI